MRYGWGQDYLQYIFNEHIILQNFLGDGYQNFSPVKRRIALWCTQTLAFLFAAVFASSPSKTILNIFVVCPAILFINTYIYYMLVCPCLQTRSVEQEEKRRKSIWRHCCCCIQCVGMCTSGYWVFMGLMWLLIYHISHCRYLDPVYWTTLLEYMYSVFVSTAVFDLVVRTRLFVFFPISIKICGVKANVMGGYYFEKESLEDLPDYIKVEETVYCCISLSILRKRRSDQQKVLPVNPDDDGLEMGLGGSDARVTIPGTVIDSSPKQQLQGHQKSEGQTLSSPAVTMAVHTETRGDAIIGSSGSGSSSSPLQSPLPVIVATGSTSVEQKQLPMQIGGID